MASIALVACWLPAGANAAVGNVASDPFIDYVAVDGGSVFYSKRGAGLGGLPVTIHRFDIASGVDSIVRTYADIYKSPTGLAAGGGRLVITESGYSPSIPGVVEASVVTTLPDGSSPRELLKQSFPVSLDGDPMGSFTTTRVTDDGEAIVLVRDPQKVRYPSRLLLVGFRTDGSSTTYFATDRAPSRQFKVSDNYFVWWTLHRVGVVKLEPNGESRVRAIRRGAYSAAVDDQGRLLLTTFLGRGRNSNQLRFFADPNSNRNKVFYSAWKSLAVGHFCGDRIVYTRQLAGSYAREITETSTTGSPIRRLYTSPAPVRKNEARDFKCDSRSAVWRAIRSSDDGGAWNLTVQFAILAD